MDVHAPRVQHDREHENHQKMKKMTSPSALSLT